MSRWIKCSERMPNYMQDVVIWVTEGDGYWIEAWIHETGFYAPGTDTTYPFEAVSHWMDPKPPEES